MRVCGWLFARRMQMANVFVSSSVLYESAFCHGHLLCTKPGRQNKNGNKIKPVLPHFRSELALYRRHRRRVQIVELMMSAT